MGEWWKFKGGKKESIKIILTSTQLGNGRGPEFMWKKERFVHGGGNLIGDRGGQSNILSSRSMKGRIREEKMKDSYTNLARVNSTPRRR